MVMGEKNHTNMGYGTYKKLLNKRDPFDQVILELGQDAVLDIGIVRVGRKFRHRSLKQYSQKTLTPRGKHSS